MHRRLAVLAAGAAAALVAVFGLLQAWVPERPGFCLDAPRPVFGLGGEPCKTFISAIPAHLQADALNAWWMIWAVLTGALTFLLIAALRAAWHSFSPKG